MIDGADARQTSTTSSAAPTRRCTRRSAAAATGSSRGSPNRRTAEHREHQLAAPVDHLRFPAVTGHGSRGTAAALLACCFASPAAAAIDDDDVEHDAESTSTTTTSTETSTTPSGGEAAPPAGTVQLYFTAGEQFEKVDRRIADNGDQLQATAEALIDGPTAADASKGVKPQTAIPSSTTVDGRRARRRRHRDGRPFQPTSWTESRPIRPIATASSAPSWPRAWVR